ncbi:hypothetical protein JCGZ_01981 [Jatropha curcas]|uniref:Uncharacterized protein n=1 Tax=Jatropha curcas TaxID=180498 RepID=A0A067JTB7_JATCU|nr:hypothetical protein JCGZ_01981 [Jatropha curcas]
MSRSHRSKSRRGREVLESKRAKRALSNIDSPIEAEAKVPKNRAPPVQMPINEDPLEEAHQLLLKIKQAQLGDMTFFMVWRRVSLSCATSPTAL